MEKPGKEHFQRLTKKMGKFFSTRKQKRLANKEAKLRKLVEKLLRKGEIIPSFLDFVRSIEEKNEQKMAWETVFSRKDLEPKNLYEIAVAIPDEYKDIRDGTVERFLKEADGKELHYAVENGPEDISKNAFNELCYRIERFRKGFIKRGLAIEILIDILKDKIREKKKELCERILQLLKILDSPADKFREILLLPSISSMPDLEKDIERFLREKHEKDQNTKLLKKIKGLKIEIAALQQELKGGQ